MSLALKPDEEKMFEGQPQGFPFGDFDLEDVMLPEGDDDFGFPSEEEEEEEEDAQTESGFANVLVVDGVPKVSQEKYQKLTSILTKILSGPGHIRENGLWHPVDEATGLSKGCVFVEYETPDQARAAQAALHGYALDKAHKFSATLYDEAERLAAVPDEYVAPEPRDAPPPENQWSWLSDRRGRDQFVARFGDETEIYWNDVAKQQPEDVYKRSTWTELFVLWTPRGSALATLHRQGVALWGGDSFGRLMRFSHQLVQRVAFSADERYAYTFSEVPPAGPRDPPRFLLIVWDVRSGRKLRVFEGPQAEFAVGAAARPDGGLAWDAFRWSGGAAPGAPSFLAHLKKGGVAVYESPDFGLVDRKSVKLDSVQSIEWSPAEPVLAAYQVEEGNMPARIMLMRFPKKEELRAKNLHSVAGVQLSWHPQGDFLAVAVEKWTKSHKSTNTHFELFSLRERDTPIDMLELPNKAEKIHELVWEPRGVRFAILHGDGSRLSVSIYSMRDGKLPGARGVAHLHTLVNKQASSLHWSPAGRFLVLAGTKQTQNGLMEFWDTEDMSLLSAGEHYMATEVQWDPTGRYLTTVVNAQNSTDNGYYIWSFAGQLLYKVERNRFYQFQWRPRPPTLLSAEKQKAILKNLKHYSKKYDEEDEAILMQADTEFLAAREKQMEEWREWQATKAEWAAEQAEAKKALLGDRLRDGDFTVQLAEVTVVLEVKEEAVKL
ncbi:EIF3B [Auxenochlorella protothecoides x Auxenochlorella symbiontica]